jgi:hypothetical protein
MAYSHSYEKLVEGTWQEYWGVRFKWTSKHLTPEQLEPLVRSYDTVATEAVEKLEDIISLYTKSLPKDVNTERTIKPNEEKNPRWDLYELIQEHASKDEKIGNLWTEINTIPEWVDWDQIERGQKIFFRYGGPAMTTVR